MVAGAGSQGSSQEVGSNTVSKLSKHASRDTLPLKW